MKKTIEKIAHIIGEIGAPFTLLSSLWLLCITKAGIGKISNRIFMKLGILPVPDQYFQPLINPEKHLRKSLREDRSLKGIDFNIEEQLNLLASFDYNNELKEFPLHKINDTVFHYNNAAYEAGDAEILYSMVRKFKPKRFIEIGSGKSTLMVRNAIKQSKLEDRKYTCRHVCVEPYEMPWLQKVDVELIREKVEEMEKTVFEQLEANDILFIDSSHVIRPQGDVLFEIFELLPILKSGVLIHFHDIFTPKDYLDNWILKEHRLWNEQYLLEAFLSYNHEFKIISALNFLKHNYPEALFAKCPVLATQRGREPGACWIRRC